MKAEWKKSPLEKAKRKEPLQDAAQRIAELEEQVRLLRFERDNEMRVRKHMAEVVHRVEMQRDQALEKAHMFDLIYHLEVMIADKDGFKLLKGKELEQYCRDHAYTTASAKYVDALARSMIQTKQSAATSIFNQHNYQYVIYPRIESQEADSQDA
jgi:hypothetical protein